MANIIIPKNAIARKRSEQARILESEGWGSGLTKEQTSKLKYLEKKHGPRFYTQAQIDKVR